MGLFDFLKPKKQTKEPVVEPVKVEPPKPAKPKYVPDLSMLELSEVNWSGFGARLKDKELLPHSYDKTPVSVKVSLTADNMPYAILTFASKNAEAQRKIEVFSRFARRANKSNYDPESVEISHIWRDFQDYVRCAISLNHRREVVMHKQKAKFLQHNINGDNQHLIEIFSNFGKFFEDENKLLETHERAKFDIFSYNEDEAMPCFSNYNSIGGISSETVIPRSPKTLEFCVAKLAEEEKHYIAHDIQHFKEKCAKIEYASPYKTPDWQKTVDILCEVICERYKDKEVEHKHKIHQAEPEKN